MTPITIGPDLGRNEFVTLPSGRAYSNADADADADALEGRRAGRPSLASGVSPQVAFRVPSSVKAKLKAVALDSGRTQAAVAREALRQFLDAA
jgi:hypothetical protein